SCFSSRRSILVLAAASSALPGASWETLTQSRRAPVSSPLRRRIFARSSNAATQAGARVSARSTSLNAVSILPAPRLAPARANNGVDAVGLAHQPSVETGNRLVVPALAAGRLGAVDQQVGVAGQQVERRAVRRIGACRIARQQPALRGLPEHFGTQ